MRRLRHGLSVCASSFFTISWSGLISSVGFSGGDVLLTHSTQHLLHLHGGFLFLGDDAGGTIRQAHGGAHIFHAITKSRLDSFEQWLEFFCLVWFRLVLQVFTGRSFVDCLEIDLTVFIDARKNNFVEVVVQNQNFDFLLLVNLQQRRSAKQGFSATGDVVDALSALPSCAISLRQGW